MPSPWYVQGQEEVPTLDVMNSRADVFTRQVTLSAPTRYSPHVAIADSIHFRTLGALIPHRKSMKVERELIWIRYSRPLMSYQLARSVVS